MIDNFPQFRDALKANFDRLVSTNPPIFQVDIDKNAFYQLYQNSFPDGTNPMYRVRREYDCSCCHHFINQVGSIVIWNEETKSFNTIWDFDAPYPFTDVCKALSAEVKRHPLYERFFIDTPRAGETYSYERDEKIIRWDHFMLNIPRAYVRDRQEIAGLKGAYNDDRKCFQRAMTELSYEAISTVFDLINSKSLYKGDEWKTIIDTLLIKKGEYERAADKELYCWLEATKCPTTISHILNSSIGTLLSDIAGGRDLDSAVRAYETIVAPANYKRSKPIFTKKMLEQAQKDITNMGYLDSLGRRYATLDDIKITNVLFANRDARAAMNAPANPFEALAAKTSDKPKDFSRVATIGIEEFIQQILPNAISVEAYFENRLTANLCSLIAPINPESKTMFKWNNNFSWAYTGNITDSQIRENVKQAGGKVDGVLRFSIQWNDMNDFNEADYDAHCVEPNNRFHIYYGQKLSRFTCGNLDVDIIHPTQGKAAVENITYPSLDRMPDGEYNFYVKCYNTHCCQASSGFRAEVEFDGKIYSFDYPNFLRDSQEIQVATVEKKGNTLTMKKEHIPSSLSSKEVWNISTNNFIPVSLVCYSPNYWQEPGVGNKHYFFMLKNCVSSETPNGFYNEFLNQELNKNRKVLEALGAQMAVQPIDNPLCGLGFSTTIRNSLVVNVKTATTSQYMKILF